MAPEPNTVETTIEADAAPEPVIIELGERSAKQIKKLRRGRGGIRRTVDGVLGNLRETGQVAKDAQVVIVVVKARPDYQSDCWRW
jgi:hypothetical protein